MIDVNQLFDLGGKTALVTGSSQGRPQIVAVSHAKLELACRPTRLLAVATIVVGSALHRLNDQQLCVVNSPRRLCLFDGD